MDYKAKANSDLNFLCSHAPYGTTVTSIEVLDNVMAISGGSLLAKGILYTVIAKQLSPSQYKISLEEANPEIKVKPDTYEVHYLDLGNGGSGYLVVKSIQDLVILMAERKLIIHRIVRTYRVPKAPFNI